MKTFSPVQVIDLSLQIKYLTPKQIKVFEDYETAPEHTNYWVILIKHKEPNMFLDGNKITGIDPL